MKVGRIGFTKTVTDAGGARVALVYPQVAQGERYVPVMVHAKVMVIDDRALCVGSANLNNRSMGTDTECDLVIVAKNDAERARVTAARNRLIGDHCGASAEEVSAALAVANGSLVELARSLRRNGHSLQPIVDTPESADELAAAVQGVADPSRPVRRRALRYASVRRPDAGAPWRDHS
jgi:phospholipase D1/2